MSADGAAGDDTAFDIDVDGLPDLEWCCDCQRARLTCEHLDRAGYDLTRATSGGGDDPVSKVAYYVQDARILLAEDEYVRADKTLKALLSSLDAILGEGEN